MERERERENAGHMETSEDYNYVVFLEPHFLHSKSSSAIRIAMALLFTTNRNQDVLYFVTVTATTFTSCIYHM